MKFFIAILLIFALAFFVGWLIWKLAESKKQEREAWDFGDDVPADNELLNVTYKGVLLPMTVKEKEDWWDKMSESDKRAHVAKRSRQIKRGKIAYVMYRGMYIFMDPQRADELMLTREKFKPRV